MKAEELEDRATVLEAACKVSKATESYKPADVAAALWQWAEAGPDRRARAEAIRIAAEGWIPMMTTLEVFLADAEHFRAFLTGEKQTAPAPKPAKRTPEAA
jgi:hypothetical protein